MRLSQDIPQFETARLLLRRAVQADVPGRLALGYDRDKQVIYGEDQTWPDPFGDHLAQRWVNDRMAERWTWVMVYDGRLIGSVKLHSLNRYDNRADVGVILLDDTLQGIGLAAEALGPVLQYGFEALALHRIGARILSTNSRGLRLFDRLGFVQEGRERNSARVGDGYQDDILLGLLADDWAQE